MKWVLAVGIRSCRTVPKYWIEPDVELAANFSLKPTQVTEAQHLIEEHLNEIRGAWAKHFPGGSH
jgi:hypothetical protein